MRDWKRLEDMKDLGLGIRGQYRVSMGIGQTAVIRKK